MKCLAALRVSRQSAAWLCFFSAVFAGLSACRPDRSGICTYTVTRIPALFGFRDFSPGDLDTILLHYMELNNGVYTVSRTQNVFGGGSSAAVSVSPGAIIDIEIPARNRTYRVDSAQHTGPVTFQFATEDESTCSLGRTFTAAPDRLRIEGHWRSQESGGGLCHYFLRP